MGAQIVGDYECGYNSLNLPNREAQVVKLLEPDALGFALWKQALWVINYWQGMHDLAGNPITAVADSDIAAVGVANNTVVGQYPDPNDPTGKAMVSGVPGVYLGDIPLEGFQGLTMLEEMHNKSVFLMQKMLTADGATLGGFAVDEGGARVRLQFAAFVVAVVGGGDRDRHARSRPAAIRGSSFRSRPRSPSRARPAGCTG